MFRFLANLLRRVVGLVLWFPGALWDSIWDRITGRDIAPVIRAEEVQADAETAAHDAEHDTLMQLIAAEEAKRAAVIHAARHDAERRRIAADRYEAARLADIHDAEPETCSFAP